MASPTAQLCREKQRLADALITETDNIISISQRYTAALARHAPLEEIKAISEEFDSAARFRASLFERYNAHLDAHGCARRA